MFASTTNFFPSCGRLILVDAIRAIREIRIGQPAFLAARMHTVIAALDAHSALNAGIACIRETNTNILPMTFCVTSCYTNTTPFRPNCTGVAAAEIHLVPARRGIGNCEASYEARETGLCGSGILAYRWGLSTEQINLANVIDDMNGRRV